MVMRSPKFQIFFCLQQLIVDFDFHTQDGRTDGLTLRIMFEAYGSAAAKGIIQDKVQRGQVRQFVSLDFPETNSLKVFLYRIDSKLLQQNRIEFFISRDHSHICCITLVPRPGVRNFDQLYFFNAIKLPGAFFLMC
jgi:hypothetical protein